MGQLTRIEDASGKRQGGDSGGEGRWRGRGHGSSGDRSERMCAKPWRAL